MTPDLFRQLVAQARLAPSVHNIQPARWRLAQDRIQLFEARHAQLPAADPDGRDVALSLGAAYEGMVLAGSVSGLSLALTDETPPSSEDLRGWKTAKFETHDVPDPLALHVEGRHSWRGSFAPASADDHDLVRTLAADDCVTVVDPETIAKTADLLDKASFGFLKQNDFRAELVSWMRLRKSNPRWDLDGMNADALQLGAVERLGAALVMGPGFQVLDRFGLAFKLLADRPKTTSAAGIVLFHRPTTENPFESGRAFYRAWLRIEAAGFKACVLAALADDVQAATSICTTANIPDDRHLVSAFRIGKPASRFAVPRARLSVDELIV